MSPFSYAGRSPSIPICDGQEMGNLLKKLTHYINSIEMFYSQIRKQAWTVYHPPPIKGIYEFFNAPRKYKAKPERGFEKNGQ